MTTVLAYQLYASRNWPLAGTLDLVASLGLAAVEGHDALYADPEALRAALDARGLAMPSGHVALARVQADPDGVIAMAKTLGMGLVVMPWLDAAERPGDAAGWADLASAMAQAARPLQQAGLRVAWHNHAFEFTPCGDGSLPIEAIAGAGLLLELDLAWIDVAGEDPSGWLRRYRGQVAAVHLKDRAAPGTRDEDGWADLGHGVIDWAPIVAALRETGVDHWVLEHDNPADEARFATRSVATARGF